MLGGGDDKMKENQMGHGGVRPLDPPWNASAASDVVHDGIIRLVKPKP